MSNKLYIAIVATAYAILAIVFDTFPRSVVSELEKRELKTFPPFSWGELVSGNYAQELSSWFSDSEPYRELFMAFSMQLKDYMRIHASEENITFHAATDEEMQQATEGDQQSEPVDVEAIENRSVDAYQNKLTANANAKIAHAGIIVIGTGENTRALMAYGGQANGGVPYANVANKYKEMLGAGVNVYCMVIPTAIEFYCPDQVRSRTKDQRATINNIFAHLSDSVKAIDIYTTLGEHAAEDIYLRTDHHWAPLGAYYAARRFAKIAHLPFRDLSAYDRKVVHGYVGSMYGYSKDIAVKNAPEDFVYYEPNDVEYTTTYTNYSIDANYHVTGEGRPIQGTFFFHYKDGSSAAYCTFMGGDAKITKVQTNTKNHRRVVILKDSFGNAIPGYLFYSFEEVHVVDFRYFTRNIIDYIHENQITDVLFANNIFQAYAGASSAYERFLHQ